MSRYVIQAASLLACIGLVACQTQVSAPEPAAQRSTSVSAPQPAQESARTSQGEAASPWCRVTGEVGARLVCPLTLDVSSASQGATGIQFRVNWPSSALKFIGLESTACAPGGAPCAAILSPPSKAVGPQGHSLVTNPQDVTTADGQATLMLYHSSNPQAALAGELGSLIFEARDTVTGTEVTLDELVATSAAATTLTLRTAGKTLQLAP